MEFKNPGDNSHADIAHIGKSVLIKGELSGSEDLFVDGEVEGRIELRGHSLSIGPNGRVRANIQARDVVVLGKVDGNINATERVELRKSAIMNGDVVTARIVVEDGAFFKGGIDIQREAAPKQAAPPPEPKREAAPQPASAATVAAGAAAAPVQGSLISK